MGMLWMRQWSIATGPVSAASRFIAIRQRTANGAGVTSSSSSSGILVVCCDICFFLRLSCLCPSSLGYHQESRDAEVRWEMRWRRRRFSSDVSGRCDCFVQNYRILLRQWVAAPPLSVLLTLLLALLLNGISTWCPSTSLHLPLVLFDAELRCSGLQESYKWWGPYTIYMSCINLYIYTTCYNL